MGHTFYQQDQICLVILRTVKLHRKCPGIRGQCYGGFAKLSIFCFLSIFVFRFPFCVVSAIGVKLGGTPQLPGTAVYTLNHDVTQLHVGNYITSFSLQYPVKQVTNAHSS